MFTVTNYQPHKRNAAVQLLLMMSVYSSAIAEIKHHFFPLLPILLHARTQDSAWREKQRPRPRAPWAAVAKPVAQRGATGQAGSRSAGRGGLGALGEAEVPSGYLGWVGMGCGVQGCQSGGCKGVRMWRHKDVGCGVQRNRGAGIGGCKDVGCGDAGSQGCRVQGAGM